MSKPWAVAALVAAMALAACAGKSGDDSGSEATPDIVVENQAFSPGEISLAAGEGVEWRVRNEDSVLHNLQQSFNFGLDTDLPAGATTLVSFTAPDGAGDYTVQCKYHAATMRLVVHVT